MRSWEEVKDGMIVYSDYWNKGRFGKYLVNDYRCIKPYKIMYCHFLEGDGSTFEINTDIDCPSELYTESEYQSLIQRNRKNEHICMKLKD